MLTNGLRRLGGIKFRKFVCDYLSEQTLSNNEKLSLTFYYLISVLIEKNIAHKDFCNTLSDMEDALEEVDGTGLFLRLGSGWDFEELVCVKDIETEKDNLQGESKLFECLYNWGDYAKIARFNLNMVEELKTIKDTIELNLPGMVPQLMMESKQKSADNLKFMVTLADFYIDHFQSLVEGKVIDESNSIRSIDYENDFDFNEFQDVDLYFPYLTR